MSLLPTYQRRVVTEREELNDRLTALDAFIATDGTPFNTLDTDEQARLRTQSRIMHEYVNILDKRIACFPK